jgi:hypothetical protein
MQQQTDRKTTPPYVSYKAFSNLLNSLRDYEHIPSRIDRTLFPTFSGSGQAAMMTSLRALNLIDEAGKPSELLQRLARAADAERPPLLKTMVQQAYQFLMTDPDFHLERATTGQVVDRFRAQGVSGSTVTKAVAFFLAAAEAGGIKVSPHVKAPPAPKSSRKPKGRRDELRGGGDEDEGGDDDRGDEDDEEDGIETFSIAMGPGQKPARVSVPAGFSSEDWEYFLAALNLYIKRRLAQSGVKPAAGTEK